VATGRARLLNGAGHRADQNLVLDLDELLRFTIEQRGSDLHLKVGSPPHIRVDGHLTPTPFDAVTPEDTERIATKVAPAMRADELSSTGETDFALSLAGLGRFRVNLFRQRGSVGLVVRRVLVGMPAFETLGLPSSITRLAEELRGLVLVTGPTGSGRTTTAAAMVDHINQTRAANIVTIEDPIEVLHSDRCAIVNQRELGTDTRDYASALRRVVRQDPDVIVIGEVADGATVDAALTAASTGHLVIAVMRATRAAEAISRLLALLPPHQQEEARHLLAGCLRGVVSQALLERADGRGRVPAVEVLVGTSRVFDVVVRPDASPAELDVLMADGEYYGMQTFDQSLLNLYKNGLVSLRDVLAASNDAHEFRIALATAGLVPT
jgi:twitching motility protein PilT